MLVRAREKKNLPATLATSAVVTFWELGLTLKVTAGPTTLKHKQHIHSKNFSVDLGLQSWRNPVEMFRGY